MMVVTSLQYVGFFKTERFQAVQESAQYRLVELVRTIGGHTAVF